MGAYSGVRHDKYNMKKICLSTLAALLLPCSAHCYDYDPDALEAPDADIYVELMGTRNDFTGFGAGYENGLRARAGLQMNNSSLGDWVWRFEVGLFNLGEGQAKTRVITGGNFGTPGVIARRNDTVTKTRINGFDFGLRLYDNEMFFLRAGGFLYSLKLNSESTLTDIYAAPPATTPTPVRLENKESESGIAPYLGLGVEYPIIDKSAKLVLEYNYLSIDNTDLNSFGAGLQLAF